jgi:hypothetical protein
MRLFNWDCDPSWNEDLLTASEYAGQERFWVDSNLKYTPAGYVVPGPRFAGLRRVTPAPPSELPAGDSTAVWGGLEPTKPTKPHRVLRARSPEG